MTTPQTQPFPAPHAPHPGRPPLRPHAIRLGALALLITAVCLLPTCSGTSPTPSAEIPPAPIGSIATRTGDEIMVAGQLVHTGAPVVLWTDPGGYDAYRVERRFSPPDRSAWSEIEEALASPNRYGLRENTLAPTDYERLRGGGWTLTDLQNTVDQFVIHYDVSGTSRQCFKILHDRRGLSVHFMLDIDGTIYQTLDVKERAWHATKANDRSVGIEIAHIGAYGQVAGTPLETWYQRDDQGLYLQLPGWMGDGGVRTPGFVARPATDGFAIGEINGTVLYQPDFTEAQYESLTRLTAALCTVLPRIECDAPRAPDGSVLTRTLTPDEFDTYSGLLGHLHVQQNKLDPGPAFDWNRVITGARQLLSRTTD